MRPISALESRANETDTSGPPRSTTSTCEWSGPAAGSTASTTSRQPRTSSAPSPPRPVVAPGRTVRRTRSGVPPRPPRHSPPARTGPISPDHGPDPLTGSVDRSQHRYEELPGHVAQLLFVVEIDDVAGDDQEGLQTRTISSATTSTFTSPATLPASCSRRSWPATNSRTEARVLPPSAIVAGTKRVQVDGHQPTDERVAAEGLQRADEAQDSRDQQRSRPVRCRDGTGRSSAGSLGGPADRPGAPLVAKRR